MREKIKRFSKGFFEYELPFITLSQEEIMLTVEAGKIQEGSFTIGNSRDSSIQGSVYSSSQLFELEESEFFDSKNMIRYRFNAASLKAGDEVKGELYIISEVGEIAIPFYIHIEAPCCMSTMGKIKDLFQFTNLAMMDWSDAKKLFRSADFERILLANEDRYKIVYRNLVKSISTSQALEEFLVTIHKKSEIVLEIDRVHCEYIVKQDNITDKLVLTKNHWGYAEIKVSTDAPYIQLDQKFVWADHFIGNTQHISYSIIQADLKNGDNYGHIFIRTVHQTITVTIECNYRKSEHRVSPKRFRQKIEVGLLDTYLSFRLNRIGLDEYLGDTEMMIARLPGPEISFMKDLMRTHLAIITGKSKLAEELLKDFQKDEAILKRKSILEYCAYLYLDALYYKDEERIARASDTIRKYYVSGHFDWKILWFLLYTEKNFENSKNVKLTYIKAQYEDGCRSPIMYYEAVCIYNEEPFLLRDLSDFEIQALNFGIKNWILSKEAAKQYTYLSTKIKGFHPVVFHGLIKLYDEYASKDILSAICCLLIKGMKKEEKYFDWYRLGVEAQLRITELYEYYMHSVNTSIQETIAAPVLLYFIYNSNLSDSKKAFLYANVVNNKECNEPIYRSYYKKMEIFALTMLEGHYINRDLAVLYHEFLNKNIQGTQVWKHLPYVIFRQELECIDSGIVSVIVVQNEIDSIEIIPLVNQKAQLNIVSDNTELIFVDSFGNRYADTVPYRITPFLDSSEYVNICILHSDHPLLLLHLFDRYQKNRILSKEAIALMEKVLRLEGLLKEYETKCYQILIEYYFDNYHDEWLDYYLNQINLVYVRHNERARYLELMIIRGLYDKSVENIRAFGLNGINKTRLVKLCSGFMKTYGTEEKQEFMVDLCYHVFCEGKYDEAILYYLIAYYSGSTMSMCSIWRASRSFELNCHALEERLLNQILLTEIYVGDSFSIFKSYYSGATNRVLVRAFLSYYAYQYLVHGQVIDSELYPIMKRELFYEQNDVCLLAWLKYHADNQSLSEQENTFVEYNIQLLVKRGIALPFFLQYKDSLSVPEQILDQYIVSYHADPRKRISIHYRLDKNKGQQYITEPLKNTFLGIHTKSFLLFYHETLQYYITQESDEETEIMESLSLQYECGNPEDDDSNYNYINLMLMALEMQDDTTLIEMMSNYAKKEYMISACFKQMDN